MTIRYTDPVPRRRRSSSAVVVVGAFGLLSWITSCSVVVDANRPQCSQDSDCTNRGPEFAGSVCQAGLCEVDPQWSCEAPPATQPHSYKVTLHLQDAVSMKALPSGVVAQLCRKLDVTCEGPVGPAVTADDGGVVTMSVEAGFDGYVQLTDPRIAPSLYFFTPPASGDLDLPSVPLASPLAAGGIVASAGGSKWLKDRGIVLLNAFDCRGQAASNITFSIGGAPDPATFIFYLVDALPTTATTVTDSTGYGGLVNVPEGVSAITATLEPSGRKVGSISILVRAGFVSYSSVTPNSL